MLCLSCFRFHVFTFVDKCSWLIPPRISSPMSASYQGLFGLLFLLSPLASASLHAPVPPFQVTSYCCIVSFTALNPRLLLFFLFHVFTHFLRASYLPDCSTQMFHRIQIHMPIFNHYLFSRLCFVPNFLF